MKWQKNMQRWIDGEWENVWREACELEKRRATSRSIRRKKVVPQSTEELKMRLWTRVKRLINDVELSEAARDIDGAGVAKLS